MDPELEGQLFDRFDEDLLGVGLGQQVLLIGDVGRLFLHDMTNWQIIIR